MPPYDPREGHPKKSSWSATDQGAEQRAAPHDAKIARWQFEKWAQAPDALNAAVYPLQRDGDGYRGVPATSAWAAWQAALASVKSHS